MDQVREVLKTMNNETHMFYTVDGHELILETKINDTQYMIEYLDENTNLMKYSVSNFSLHYYVTMYDYEGRL